MEGDWNTIEGIDAPGGPHPNNVQTLPTFSVHDVNTIFTHHCGRRHENYSVKWHVYMNSDLSDYARLAGRL